MWFHRTLCGLYSQWILSNCPKCSSAILHHVWFSVFKRFLFLFPFITFFLSFFDDDCFYYHSWRNNVVIAFGTLSSFLTLFLVFFFLFFLPPFFSHFPPSFPHFYFCPFSFSSFFLSWPPLFFFNSFYFFFLVFLLFLCVCVCVRVCVYPVCMRVRIWQFHVCWPMITSSIQNKKLDMTTK